MTIANRLFDRAVLRLSAQDDRDNVTDFLQGLVTNDVSGVLPVYAALLSAQGKALFDFLVWRDGEDLLLDCEAESADELRGRLSLYRLRRKIDIKRDESLAVHWSTDAHDGAVRDPRLAELGWRWIERASASDEAADAAWLNHRLSRGVTEGRSELGDILWLETNAVELNAVSFDKGCYIGQENTARMNWRKKVNRRLIVVPLEQSNEKRRRAAYPELGFAVDHLRVSELNSDTIPDWMRPGLTPAD